MTVCVLALPVDLCGILRDAEEEAASLQLDQNQVSEKLLVSHLGTRQNAKKVVNQRSVTQTGQNSTTEALETTVMTVLKKMCNSTGTVWAHCTTLGQSAASESSSSSVLSRSMVSPEEGDE